MARLGEARRGGVWLGCFVSARLGVAVKAWPDSAGQGMAGRSRHSSRGRC